MLAQHKGSMRQMREGRVGGGARLETGKRWRRARGFQGVEVEQMAF